MDVGGGIFANLHCVFSKHYVDLSFGRIERRMVWPAVGMSVLVAVANLFVSFFAVSMLDSYLFSND